MLAGSVLVTMAIQLALQRKEGLVTRMMASLGGALVICAVAAALYRRRVVEALNAGRRVSYFALRDDCPDLYARVKSKVVSNGGFFYRGLNWEPLPVPTPNH